jgi:pyruvate formate lyase activating enzyme
LAAAKKKNDLHTCLETSGEAPFERFRELLDLVDLFLWDVKETDSRRHREFTGVDNERILENMRNIDRRGGKLILRCPIIPGFNDRDSHFAAIAAEANALRNLAEVHLLPYHPLGGPKRARLGKTHAPPEDPSFPEETKTEQWLRQVQDRTNVPVRRG